MYKPWSKEKPLLFMNSSASIQDEFHDFLASSSCPLNVKLGYLNAYESFMKRQDSSDVEVNESSEIPLEAQEMLDAALRSSKSNYVDGVERGLDYDFSRCVFELDMDCLGGLEMEAIVRESKNISFCQTVLPLRNGLPYNISDVNSDKQQSFVVYSVLRTIREWIRFCSDDENNDYGDVSEKRKDYLKKNALWVYPTMAEVDAHNFEAMRKLVHKDNPLIRLPCKICTADQDSLQGCRVTLDRNYYESIGLFNGSTGTVQEIRYRPGTSPLRGDFPAYVLVDVDTYNGVPWNPYYPKFVPIYPLKVFCRKGCCILEYFPISLAFAKTIHRIQGKEFGPRSKNLPALVANIGQRVLESMFLGITYVILSRVSNIGNGNPDNSVIVYFSGPMFEENRFTDLTHKTNSSTLYKRYEDRLRWISHIEQVALSTDITIADEDKDDLENWARHSSYNNRC